ncbi:hypothetical protein [Streptomyces sp. NPDC050121]|uniref:hypothetical protein n=1 Tax=Streptomyces sp. NPDC050121 TaxID=3365601 RepID=UPI0037A555E7
MRVRTGTATQSLLTDLFGFEGLGDEHEEWYPEPGIEIDYAPDSAFDLCALLAVAQRGHARLEFLTRRADGSFQRLRSVRARVRRDDTVVWRRWALGVLSDASVVSQVAELKERAIAHVDVVDR